MFWTISFPRLHLKLLLLRSIPSILSYHLPYYNQKSSWSLVYFHFYLELSMHWIRCWISRTLLILMLIQLQHRCAFLQRMSRFSKTHPSHKLSYCSMSNLFSCHGTMVCQDETCRQWDCFQNQDISYCSRVFCIFWALQSCLKKMVISPFCAIKFDRDYF